MIKVYMGDLPTFSSCSLTLYRFCFIQGVFSDTHLLALMYAGELCYWHWRIEKETSGDLGVRDVDENGAKTFNSVSNGRRFLEKFVDIVKESFKGKGWDSTRAEQILGEFAVS